MSWEITTLPLFPLRDPHVCILHASNSSETFYDFPNLFDHRPVSSFYGGAQPPQILCQGPENRKVKKAALPYKFCFSYAVTSDQFGLFELVNH